MGGEGSIAGMITSLKNNNNLRRKISFFKKGSKDYTLHYKTHIKNNPALSDEELLQFRKKLVRQKRINDIKQIIVLLVVITVAALTLKYFFDEIKSFF